MLLGILSQSYCNGVTKYVVYFDKDNRERSITAEHSTYGDTSINLIFRRPVRPGDYAGGSSTTDTEINDGITTTYIGLSDEAEDALLSLLMRRAENKAK